MKILCATLCLLAVSIQVHADKQNLSCIDSIALEQTVVEVFDCEEKDHRFGAPRILTACEAKISNKFNYQCLEARSYKLTIECMGILETTGKDVQKKPFTRATKRSVTSAVTLNTERPGPMYLGYTYMDFSFIPDEIIHTADLLVTECRITDREPM